ncbi:MAG TPA: serine hydrolase [Gemmatimonadaceae bacterium]|nr:serine hydrolase [Gemmatimonadaceae bacterium]
MQLRATVTLLLFVPCAPMAPAAHATPRATPRAAHHRHEAATRSLRADTAGMLEDRLALVDYVMARALAARGFPGAAVAIGRDDAVTWLHGYGRTDWSEESARVSADSTLYDVASLTKVIATTAAIMVLYDEGRIHLDDRVSRWLPAFRGGLKEQVTIRQLLTHRSGLPAGRDLWRAHDPAAARRLALGTPLMRVPGEREIYSDIGAIVLGMVAEAAAGEPLDRFVTRRVFRPLGMRHTFFNPPARWRRRAAPTERSVVRARLLRGEVHDENAAALGGVAGHAGLFSTAADLSIFARMLLGGGEYHGVRIVSDSTVALFTAPATAGRALGWQLCQGGGSCGHRMGPTAYGHTGFTGTSLWIDPERRTFVVVLTNAVRLPPEGRDDRWAVLSDVRGDLADLATVAVADRPGGAPPMPDVLRADLAIGWGIAPRARIGASAAAGAR